MSENKAGLLGGNQTQALTTKTERPVKAALFSVDQAVKIIRAQQAADVAFDLILTNTQQPDFLADTVVLTENPRAFLRQIQKRIIGSAHG